MNKIILTVLLASMVLSVGCFESKRNFSAATQDQATVDEPGTTGSDSGGLDTNTIASLYNSMNSPCDITLTKAYARLALKNPDANRATEFETKNIYKYLEAELTVYAAPVAPRTSPFNKKVCMCYGTAPCNSSSCKDSYLGNGQVLVPYDKEAKKDVPYYLLPVAVSNSGSIVVSKEELRALLRSTCLSSIDYSYKFGLPLFIGEERTFRKIAANAYGVSFAAAPGESVLKAWMVFNALERIGVVKSMTAAQAKVLPKSIRFTPGPNNVPMKNRLPQVYYFDKTAIEDMAR